MLKQEAAFTSPQARGVNADGSVQITQLCCALSGDIGGVADEYCVPPLPEHYHK